MRLFVTASRHWKDRARLWSELDAIHAHSPIRLLIHGGAPGGDHDAEAWARARKIATATLRPADPTRKSDYLARNALGVEISHTTIAFRAPGKSNGTDYTIAQAEAAGKLWRVVKERE